MDLVYVVDLKTTQDVHGPCPFITRKEACKFLFPDKFKLWEMTLSKDKLNSAVASKMSQIINVSYPTGVKTQIGRFWVCCKPNDNPLLSKKHKSFFLISVLGLCTWYLNNAVYMRMRVKPYVSRRTVSRLLSNNKLDKSKSFRLQVFEDSIILNLFPELTLPTKTGTVIPTRSKSN